MAQASSEGQFEPLNLALSESVGGFAPERADVNVAIPRRLSEGVSIGGSSDVAIALTPVNAEGESLSADAAVSDGTSVFYANIEADLDAVAKPTATGAELSAVLRAADSPTTLHYRISAPAGASLVQDDPGRGSVRVVADGATLAAVLPPSAEDAEGTQVPVSMTLHGDVLTITVTTGAAGEYRYPIEVDPTVIDNDLAGTVWPAKHTENTNWTFIDYSPENRYTYHKGYVSESNQYWEITGGGGSKGEFAGVQYETQGASTIYKFVASTNSFNIGSPTRSQLELDESSGTPIVSPLIVGKEGEDTSSSGATLCLASGCEPTHSHSKNIARYNNIATGSGYGAWDEINKAEVYILQETAPTVSFNKEEQTIDSGRTNVAYGESRSTAWLSPSSGAFEVKARDPGIGISYARLSSPGSAFYLPLPFFEEGVCGGVQCNESYSTFVTYNPSMKDGEDSFEWWAEDAARLADYTSTVIRVDGTPPYNLKLKGLPEGGEVSAAPHTLTLEATDGTESTKSSGIKSITASIDGGAPTPASGASCPAGLCTGKGEWTLHGEALAEGVHRIVLTATDNAGNIASKEYTFDVRHASPISLGPGALDPTSGQLTLSATDVSLGGGIGVSRTYESRTPTASAEGPLGPQWTINLGSSERLSVLSDGSVELISADGGRTTWPLHEGKYESPTGDSNLTLEAKEKEPGKGITEYVLKDVAKGTATTFTQPSGGTPISFANQFGAEASQLKGPLSTAVDASGNVWVTDSGDNRIMEFSAAGAPLAAYGSYGTALGQMTGPWGVAVDQRNGNVFVTDQANNRVEELNSAGSFLRSFGWGVKDGAGEFEVCTSGCRAGIAGSGSGQFSVIAGVAVDGSGNVWVADYGNNRIEEFGEKGEYLKQFGTKGTEAGKFEGPLNIAFSAGNLYVTDYGNNRVQEFSTSGTPLAQFSGSEGTKLSHPYGIAADPRSGVLYVADSGNGRVEEFTAAGAYVAKLGGSGSGPGQFTIPTGVAVDGSGKVYVADYSTNRIEQWARSLWLPTIGEGPLSTEHLSSDTTTYAFETVEVEGRQITRPSEALAPPPPGVSCTPKLERGCRALTFNYATATTATGENEAAWGDYKGNLTRVYYHAWDPAKGAMVEEEVAHYLFDSRDYLRAEWDPRIEKSADCGGPCAALKTIYGDDAEGHITAVSRAGVEPWLIHYGTIAGDANTGRLLSVTRPSAATALGAGRAPAKLSRPSLSTTTPAAGTSLSVTNGSWQNTPLAYSYQWDDCSPSGTECAPIAGAVNQSYTPVVADEGHALVAVVSATNAQGTGTYASLASSPVLGPTPTYSLQFGSTGTGGGQFRFAAGDAVDSSGNVWVSDIENNRIEKFSPAGSFIGAYGSAGSGAGQFNNPQGVAVNQSTGVVYVCDKFNSRVEEFSSTGSYLGAFGSNGTGNGQFQTPRGITIDASGNVWVTDDAADKISEFSSSGSFIQKFGGGLGTGNGQFKRAEGIAVAGGLVYVADGENNRVQEFSLEGVYVAQFGSAGTGNGQFNWPTFIATDPKTGAIYVADYQNGRVQEFGPGGGFIASFGSKGSGEGQFEEPMGVAVDAGSGAIYVTDYRANKVEQWLPKAPTAPELPTPPNPGSSAVTTVEYHIPTSGTGLPSLTPPEAAKWAQHELPQEGTAVFPPDEPMGWPAKDYKRATIHYLDAKGHEVNTALPSGGISTTEFNWTNDVERTLSADNRAVALSEGSKSAEVAERLDTKDSYNFEGNELLQTVGPEHKVKLPSGVEVGARHIVKYHYDEGAPGGAQYGLVTKQTDGALVEGTEEDVRTTLSSYAGQEGLGWKLRKATSTTTDPTGLDLVHKILYDKETGNVIEARNPAGNAETIYPFAYSSSFGSEGTGNGQFKHPAGSSIDAAGNLWVVDEGNNRVQKLSSSGSFIAAYGTKGSGSGQFLSPWGIAINQSTGNVYVADKGNSRIEELSSSGAYVASFGTSGSGALKEPTGVAIDAEGHVWASDWGHNRLVEFSAEGVFIREAGSSGSGSGQINGPGGLVFSEGSVFVADYYNNRVDQFSASSGASLGQFGSSGSGNGQFKEPYAVAANLSTGTLYVSDFNNGRVEEFSPAGRYLTSWQTWGPTHRIASPTGISIAATGKLYASDLSGNQVTVWTPPEAGAAQLSFASQFGTSGSGEGQFSTPINTAIDGEGNIWVTDCGNNRIEKFSAKASFIAAYGKEGSGNGEYHCPGGIDINQSTGNIYVADTSGARIEELSSSGSFIRAFGTEGSGKLSQPGSIKLDSAGNLWVPDMSADRIVEFSATGAYIAAYGKEGTGEVQFKQPTGIAFVGENLYVADSRNHRVQELTNKGAFIRQFGKEGEGGGELEDPEGIATDAASHLYVVDAGASHVEEFTSSGGYMATFATKGTAEGQLKAPIGDAIDAAGDLYVVDTQDNRIEKWNTAAVHDTKTVYYSVGANSEFPGCGGHPEWANLPCETLPGAQPNTPGVPNLPVTTFAYNLWYETETTTEVIGSVTRTKKETFDAAGRAVTSEETASIDTPLPKTTNEYVSQTGALEKQSTTTEGKTETITSVQNKLEELEKYTDADGNTSTYKYDIDQRVEELTDGKGFQIYIHDSTSGYLTELLDSAAGKFKATYTAEGKLTGESYPNGMTASYGLNALDSATSLAYVKTTHCSEKCTLYSDSISVSIRGETLSQSSTLASETYTHNSVGWLTQTQETPVGRGCTTRLYEYDEEEDRVRLVTREPGGEGKCASEGGTAEPHKYDSARRLTDAGVTYDGLGNATKLPAADAGGNELTSGFYVDGQVATQTQSGETLNDFYDPVGRTREAIASGKSSATVVSHYSGPGEAPTWTSEGGEAWTRNIPGIDGSLCATQTNGGTPTLQLHDLSGNIVATAALSETEAKLLSTYSSTEFGVPQPGTTPPKYAWLGAGGVATEPSMSSGVVTKGGASYVPQVARDLQTFAVVAPGAFPNGQGLGSPYTATVSVASLSGARAEAEKVWEEVEAERRRAAAEAACKAAPWTCTERGEDPLLTIQLNQSNSEALYALALETYYGAPTFSALINTLVIAGGAEGESGALTTREFAEREFGELVVDEWLWQLTHSLYNCVYEAEHTIAGGSKTCQIEFFAIHVKGNENYVAEIDEPEFNWLPTVSYCQYGVCYIQDPGLREQSP